MFGSVFGLYSVRIAFTMTSYNHDRGVVSAFKISSIFPPQLGGKFLKGFLRGFSTEAA